MVQLSSHLIDFFQSWSFHPLQLHSLVVVGYEHHPLHTHTHTHTLLSLSLHFWSVQPLSHALGEVCIFNAAGLHSYWVVLPLYVFDMPKTWVSLQKSSKECWMCLWSADVVGTGSESEPESACRGSAGSSVAEVQLKGDGRSVEIVSLAAFPWPWEMCKTKRWQLNRVMETDILRETSQIWPKGFNALMRWCLSRCIHIEEYRIGVCLKSVILSQLSCLMHLVEWPCVH